MGSKLQNRPARHLRMRSTRVYIVLFLAVCLFPTTGLSQVECGTVVAPEDVPLVWQLIRSGAYQLPGGVASQPYIVPITFHAVRSDEGAGEVSEARIEQALDDANLAFIDTGIVFCKYGYTRFVNSDLMYFEIDSQNNIDQLRQIDVVQDTINVYVTQVLGNETGELCGQSTFTWNPIQGIVVDTDCFGLPENPSTVPHELGHYVDLFHTHETAFGLECVNGSNCAVAGDLLCDTAADPRLGDENVSLSCNYFGGQIGPCDGDPPYDPDTQNYMSYSRKTCRDRFSPQQEEKSLATLLNLRPELVNEACPEMGPCDVPKFLPSDAAAGDQFGDSVALSSKLAVMGRPGDDTNGPSSGAVHVLHISESEWGEEYQLLPDDNEAEDRFGSAVAIDGDTVVVGAVGADDLAGKAYVYHFDGLKWAQQQVFLPPELESLDLFGLAVDVAGDNLVIGAPADDDSAANAGAVYAYRFDGEAWALAQKLTLSPGVEGQQLGASVGLFDDTLVVGSKGSVVVYESDGLSWIEQQQIMSPAADPDDGFGEAVAVDNRVFVVGAAFGSEADVSTGVAYVFRDSGAKWLLEQKLFVDNGEEGDGFGLSVALSGDYAVIGAPSNEDAGATTGSVYLFTDAIGIDCNNNGIPDGCEILTGLATDADADGIPDECAPVIGDVDGDGDVDTVDLLLLLGDWGPCNNCNSCAADFDGDCLVGTLDLILLLGNWG